jgi:hypothetical protein
MPARPRFSPEMPYNATHREATRQSASRRSRTCVLLVALVLLTGGTRPTIAAQADIEGRLRDRYENQVVTLRGFPAGSRLHYDASGDWRPGGLGTIPSGTYRSLRDTGPPGPEACPAVIGPRLSPAPAPVVPPARLAPPGQDGGFGLSWRRHPPPRTLSPQPGGTHCRSAVRNLIGDRRPPVLVGHRTMPS